VVVPSVRVGVLMRGTVRMTPDDGYVEVQYGEIKFPVNRMGHQMIDVRHPDEGYCIVRTFIENVASIEFVPLTVEEIRVKNGEINAPRSEEPT